MEYIPYYLLGFSVFVIAILIKKIKIKPKKVITQKDVEEYISSCGITKIEIIDESGRAYTEYSAEKVIMKLQSDCKILKVFVNPLS